MQVQQDRSKYTAPGSVILTINHESGTHQIEIISQKYTYITQRPDYACENCLLFHLSITVCNIPIFVFFVNLFFVVTQVPNQTEFRNHHPKISYICECKMG